VLTKAYSRRIQGDLTLVQFVKLRLIRLYPLFLLGLLLGLVAVSIKMAAGTSDYTWRDLTQGFVLNLAVLPFPNHGAITIMNSQEVGMLFPFNSPNWSLFFELAANLSVFAFIKMRLYSVKGTMWVVALSFLCFGFSIFAGRGDSGWGLGISHFGIGLVRTTFCFYSGVLMAAVHSRLDVRFNINPVFAMAIVAGFILLCLRRPSNAQYFVAVLLLPIGVYCGSYVRTNELAKSVCRHLGDLSYPLYCVHFPILMLVDSAGFYFFRHDYWVAEIISGCTLSIIAAWALAKYFDAPVRQRLMMRHRNQLAGATDGIERHRQFATRGNPTTCASGSASFVGSRPALK
jgi:peptidoglycan/LPS O-acetylase OafA/YrhL